MPTNPTSIDNLLQEHRVFEPPTELAATAHVASMAEYEALVKRADDDPDRFWGDIARGLHWMQPWTKVCDWDPPDARWFVGGRTNVAYNCLDRHLDGPRRNKAALIFEGEPGDTTEVSKVTPHGQVAALKSKGACSSSRMTPPSSARRLASRVSRMSSSFRTCVASSFLQPPRMRVSRRRKPTGLGMDRFICIVGANRVKKVAWESKLGKAC